VRARKFGNAIIPHLLTDGADDGDDDDESVVVVLAVVVGVVVVGVVVAAVVVPLELPHPDSIARYPFLLNPCAHVPPKLKNSVPVPLQSRAAYLFITTFWPSHAAFIPTNEDVSSSLM